MKKIVAGLCFFVCTISFAKESEMEEFEIELEEIGTNDLRPIFINISVANIQDAHSSNKTNSCQKQADTQEEKQEKRSSGSSHLALLALLIALQNEKDSANWWGAEW